MLSGPTRFAALLLSSLSFVVTAGAAPAETHAGKRAAKDPGAQPVYRDNRSTPEAVIRSLYNAINRKEYARAYGYFADKAAPSPFDAFAKGYQGTTHVSLKLGKATSEGAAGSTYWTVPAAIRAKRAGGKAETFAGCYTLRLANPEVQATPPFQPIAITKGDLKPAEGPLAKALPDCSHEGAAAK